MEREQLKDSTIFEFKNIQLLKEQSLGIGSYGAVCKAKCDDLLCAAKIIHPTLFDTLAIHQPVPHQREHRLPLRRFEQECEFLSAVRHPNIVQYLGMYTDSSTHLPVLLMELMDDSLTHFLENSRQPLLFHIQVSICHDIALALSYLHSNGIIHRDLSSNNVLLRGNILAKVSDFGMARLSDINHLRAHLSNTMCPGTAVYMPPEAVRDNPIYTEKIDCFSLGVIAVQILTRKFPNPSDRLLRIKINHPELDLPSGQVLVEVQEIDRRQHDLNEIERDHPLLPVITDCLKDQDHERPTAHQICERLVELRDTVRYSDSIRSISDREEEVLLLAKKLEEYNRLMLSQQEENQSLKEQVQCVLKEKDEELQQLTKDKNTVSEQLESCQRQHQRVKQQLEEAEQVLAQFERRIIELEKEIECCQEDQLHLQASSSRREVSNLSLSWRKGKRAPHNMSRCSDAVVTGSVVYFRDAETSELYSCDIVTEIWSKLPNCKEDGGSIVVVDGILTIVGGFDSNDLFSLIGEGSSKTWTTIYPPMPTKRYFTTSLCIKTALIVAGGQGKGRQELATVEVMNTKTHKWTAAANLPQPMFLMSAAVCGNHIYMLGGHDIYHSIIKSVYTCSVSDLLESPVTNLLKSSLRLVRKTEKPSIWKKISDLPVTSSNCESINDHLLAIGGMEDSMQPTSAVYMYNSTTNSWEIVSHMSIARYCSLTAVLPENRIMVVGGCLDYTTTSDVIEYATV